MMKGRRMFMTHAHQSVRTDALYMNLDRGIATLDFSKYYVNNFYNLINSKGLLEIVRLYLTSSHHTKGEKRFENLSAEEYVGIIKRIFINDEHVFDEFTAQEILASFESLYSFYRSFLRVSITHFNQNSIITHSFKEADARFNELVIRAYRTIEEKLQGFVNNVYRQVDAGTNATLLVRDHKWQTPTGYESLVDIPFIDKVMLRPPMLMHTKSNKREGIFSAVNTNPITRFNGKRGDWYCYPAKIGETLTFVYFNVDYMVNGIALSNLFELATAEEVTDQKPDAILLFGIDHTEGEVSHYHYDAKNDLWVGEVPYNDKTTYFGYMKKMCLTLHNLHQIYRGKLPIHGSMVRIKFTNGKDKTVVFFGDSGAGKSESLEALQEIADEQIVDMETIFDDMGSFTISDSVKGGIYAQGTETGAFVRLDDLSSSVAFSNMDRGVFLNPEQKNARVIIPADAYENVIAHHEIDMWVYANNYSDKIGIHRFENENEAKKVFIAGKRKALGTTDEVGMSSTFFANPFGPVQESDRTKPIIDEVFNRLFKDGIYVGEVYTHLGTDKSKEALHESAQELLDQLMNS
jgi:energy-coupling factor transporter ATP-binding protein EcfA2